MDEEKNENDTGTPEGKLPPLLQEAADDEMSELGQWLRRRLLFTAMGLHRVCVVKRCRRYKRCCEEVCVQHHHGLARARFRSALKKLGWAHPDDDAATPAGVKRAARRR